MRPFRVTSVRNEVDVIEALVRHNLTVLDGLVVIDHGSLDGTAEILAKLQREGLHLRVVRDPKDRHFDRASLILLVSVVPVRRRFSVVTGCLARMWWHFRADADAKVAARTTGRPAAQARPASRTDERRRSWLPGEALVELVGRSDSIRNGSFIENWAQTSTIWSWPL
jgi:hypothetical protein